MKKIVIQGSECTTKQGLFDCFSTAFDFPDYFADNWDSFDEIMTDLSWIEEPEIELELKDYSLILSEEPDEEIDTFYNILSNIEEYSGKTFSVVLESEGDQD